MKHGDGSYRGQSEVLCAKRQQLVKIIASCAFAQSMASIRDGSLLHFRKPPLHLSEIALWKIHWIKGIIHVQCVERFKVPLHMERN
jgi:hypothetical protein